MTYACLDASKDLFTPVETIRIPELEAEEEEQISPRELLYNNMKRCVFCGAKLVPVVLDVKDCPCGHGKAYTAETAAGLPAIVFETFDQERSDCDQQNQ